MRLVSNTTIPCVLTIKHGIAVIAARIRLLMTKLIIESSSVTLCIDLWTAKDGTHILGITAHFYCSSKKQMIRLVIGCRQLFEPATAPYIAKLIDKVWTEDFGRDLGSNRIAHYQTDNGANLVKCCRVDLPQLFAITAANDSIEDVFQSNDANIGLLLCLFSFCNNFHF